MCQGRAAPDTCSCPSFIAPIPGRLLSSRARFRLCATRKVAIRRSVCCYRSLLVWLIVADHSAYAVHELVTHGVHH